MLVQERVPDELDRLIASVKITSAEAPPAGESELASYRWTLAAGVSMWRDAWSTHLRQVPVSTICYLSLICVATALTLTLAMPSTV